MRQTKHETLERLRPHIPNNDHHRHRNSAKTTHLQADAQQFSNSTLNIIKYTTHTHTHIHVFGLPIKTHVHVFEAL